MILAYKDIMAYKDKTVMNQGPTFSLATSPHLLAYIA